jgi:polar amino acid transport system substrate-binding protein
VGVQGGTIQAAYAEENLGGNNTVVSFGTADQAMADLAAGNLDTILADGAYLEPVVAAAGGSLEFVGEDVMIGNGVGAGLRKDDTELKTKLDDALTALKADGTVDKLIAQYFEGRGPYFAE